MPIAHTKDNLKLNDYLVQRRKFLKISFSDLAHRTSIPIRHLKKMEKGEWCDLPPGVYVKGFLKKYAQAVGLDEGELALRYESEWQNICLVPGVSRKAQSGGRFGFLNQISFRRAIIGLAGLFILSYLAWQLEPILEHPKLVLSSPASEDTNVTSPNFSLEGQITPGSILTINNEQIYAEENGGFKKEIELLPGLNVLEIKAVSRFGQESKIVKRVTYNP